MIKGPRRRRQGRSTARPRLSSPAQEDTRKEDERRTQGEDSRRTRKGQQEAIGFASAATPKEPQQSRSTLGPNPQKHRKYFCSVHYLLLYSIFHDIPHPPTRSPRCAPGLPDDLRHQPRPGRGPADRGQKLRSSMHQDFM